ncbi:hypothetical protein F4780DRAFT_784983 [Xylariomycetidae sp. FL0641]|nr:hypothetical protein F4780DRAFT_784983 [Xylariomycetidae sp. FL0641]
MHFSNLLLSLAALPFLASGTPIASAPSEQAIATATNKWAQDTSRVSNFLSRGGALRGAALTRAAAAALAAEKNELVHKEVLDRAFLQRNDAAAVAAADRVLVDQGTFQDVVDGLDTLARKGAAMTPRQIADTVDRMNQGRCKFVLPAIDVYFQASAQVTRNGLAAVANRPIGVPGC